MKTSGTTPTFLFCAPAVLPLGASTQAVSLLMYKFILRPILFLIDPETVHHLVTGLLRFIGWIPGGRSVMRALYTYRHRQLERTLMGLTFPNPVGLAAGFDKDARFIDELSCLGFGFVEIGTITPRSQPGNEKPRLFRLPVDQALINRMGFNNDGVEAAVRRLKNRRSHIIIGGNIGKNKTTPNESAHEDYAKCVEALYDYVDYFVVNVSSPNTPGLRELQEKEPLKKLLTLVKDLLRNRPGQKPVLLKIAPDLTVDQLNDVVEILLEVKIDGVIATNTTISREHLSTTPSKVEAIGPGGLSGKPLGPRSTEVIRYLRERLGPTFPIIGVGGIMSIDDVREKLNAGANLVQVYTGFIYEGPAFVKRITRELAESN